MQAALQQATAVPTSWTTTTERNRLSAGMVVTHAIPFGSALRARALRSSETTLVSSGNATVGDKHRTHGRGLLGAACVLVELAAR